MKKMQKKCVFFDNAEVDKNLCDFQRKSCISQKKAVPLQQIGALRRKETNLTALL